jgi:hypothetical protein
MLTILTPLKIGFPKKICEAKIFWEEEKQRSVFGDLIY